MTAVLGWLLGAALLGWFEMKRMWRKQEKYEMWLFAAMLAAVTAYGILFSLEVPLPDPLGLIRKVFGPLGERLMGQRGA